MEFQRYAIYYTPPSGQLADFGAAWLGWDIATGLPIQHPIIHGYRGDISQITSTPRKYGFHGTIKPPFRLADGMTPADLMEQTASVCARLNVSEMEGLELNTLGRFLALTVKGDASPLANIASTVVRELDNFRAPPTEAELEKRRKARLSVRQEQYLMEWGYPYVMEEFRFHLTLSGRLEIDEAEALKSALQPIMESTLPPVFRVDDLTLVGEDLDGQFHEIQRLRLGGGQ